MQGYRHGGNSSTLLLICWLTLLAWGSTQTLAAAKSPSLVSPSPKPSECAAWRVPGSPAVHVHYQGQRSWNTCRSVFVDSRHSWIPICPHRFQVCSCPHPHPTLDPGCHSGLPMVNGRSVVEPKTALHEGDPSTSSHSHVRSNAAPYNRTYVTIEMSNVWGAQCDSL